MTPFLAGFSDELNGLEKAARPLKKLLAKVRKHKGAVGRPPLVPRRHPLLEPISKKPVPESFHQPGWMTRRPKKFDMEAWQRKHWQEKSRGQWRGHTGEPALVKRTDRTPAELKKMRAERRRMSKTSAELVKTSKPLKKILGVFKKKPLKPIDLRELRTSPGAPSYIRQTTAEDLKETAKRLRRVTRGTRQPIPATGKRQRTPREGTPPPAERLRTRRRLPQETVAPKKAPPPAQKSRARRRSPRETVAPQERPYRGTELRTRWIINPPK